MNAPSLPALYNQRSQSDEEFVAHFVARKDLLETLLRRLQTAEPDSMGSHQILIGPRGMGKTSLLRRIAIAINRDPALAAGFVPLSFREEQYNVLTLGDFWRNCGESLAEWAEATGRPDLASRIDLALPSSAWATDEGAGSQFVREMATLKRRAVLLVDNLNLILGTLPSESAWILRRHLQSRQGPILIGAATQPLAQAADREAAFYEFFHPVYLESLSEAETKHCMNVLAQSGGTHGAQVVRVLNEQPERLRTLHTLTGGNPRVLALIYRLLGTGESQAAMADLEALLDQVTPFYKARIEDYESAQQRAAIDAIALHWDPITTSSLARLTGIAATTLSPLLIRLRKDGLIEQVELSGAYAGHQLVERFLNIWYLMRHGTRRAKQKMRWLVAFLASFYSFHELTEIANRTPERDLWQPDYRLAFDEALQRAKIPGLTRDPITPAELSRPEQTISAALAIDDRLSPVAAPYPGEGPAIAVSHQASPESPVALAAELVQQAISLNLGEDRSAALAIYEEVLARFPNPTEPSLQAQVIRALNGKAIALTEIGDPSAGLALYDDVFARFADAPESALREQVGFALLGKAITLGWASDTTAAIAAYDDLLARFADAPEPALREQVARALFNKAITLEKTGDSTAEIATYDDLLARFADAPEPFLREQVARALLNKAITLGQAGDGTAEIALYDDLLARFADAPEPALREQVARALLNKAITLGQAGNSTAEIALYDDLLARFADAPEPALRGRVALALVNKALTLEKTGDNTAAIAAYDDLLARFADAPEPALREQVARALFNKAFTLGQAGDGTAEIALYDDLLARFSDAPEPALREQVARALLNKAITFGQAGDSTAAIATYNDLLARFIDAPEPALREQVAFALVNKAVTLGQAGDGTAEVALYDDVLARFADAPELALREQTARALFNKAFALEKTGDNIAEIALYDDLLARFSDAPELALRAQVARALLNKAITLGQASDSSAAIAAYDDLLARFADAPEPALRERVALALLGKAVKFRQAGNSTAEIAVYDDLLARFADAPEPALRERVALALVNKAFTLEKTGDGTAAIATYDHLLARFVDAPELALREQVARALFNKAITLGRADDSTTEITLYDDLLARFADAPEPTLREFVAFALINKAVTLRRAGDSTAAIALYDGLLARFADAPEPALREQVAHALVNKAITLRQAGDSTAAIAVYEQLLEATPAGFLPLSLIDRATAQVSLGNLLLDSRADLVRPEALYLDAASAKPDVARANLAWFYLLANRLDDAIRIRQALETIPAPGLALLEAGIELAKQNFGAAIAVLPAALDTDLEAGIWTFADDLDRLLRLAERNGFGERLIDWFETTGFADRLAPVYIAFKAYVRAEKLLLDANPEVRRPARAIYDRLDAPRRYAAQSAPRLSPPSRRGGRKQSSKS